MNRNPLIAGLVTAVLLLLTAFLLVFPQGGRVSRAELDLSQAETRLLEMQADLAALKRFAESGDRLTRVNKVRAQIPSDSALPALFATLRGAAREANVQLVSINPGLPSASLLGGASAIPVGITVQGNYFELGAFLFELETLDRLARVNGISIGQGSGEGQLSLQVAFEVYTTDPMAGPGTDPAPGEDVA